jgi:hypothetical protein
VSSRDKSCMESAMLCDEGGLKVKVYSGFVLCAIDDPGKSQYYIVAPVTCNSQFTQWR